MSLVLLLRTLVVKPGLCAEFIYWSFVKDLHCTLKNTYLIGFRKV